jgi:hypothetical protein
VSPVGIVTVTGSGMRRGGRRDWRHEAATRPELPPSVVMADRIIGCPHEEGIGYEGATCPACPFWAGRDRWTGKRLRQESARDPVYRVEHSLVI